MAQSCVNSCSCKTTWLLSIQSGRFFRRELHDIVLVAERQWKLLLLNTQFSSELQNCVEAFTAGRLSDMINVKKKPVTKFSHRILRPKKSEFKPAIAISMWENGTVYLSSVS